MECLGLILGHPFLEKFGYKSGRQMCGLPPPLLGSKQSRLLGDRPKHPGPPLLFIPGLPSFSGAWFWLFNLSPNWAIRVEVHVKVPGATHPCLSDTVDGLSFWRVSGFINQKSAPWAESSWEAGVLGLCLGFVLACCCIAVVTQPLLPPAFNRQGTRL